MVTLVFLTTYTTITLSHFPKIDYACVWSVAYQEQLCHLHSLSLLARGRVDTLIKCDNLFSEK